MQLNDLRYALRRLARSPGFTLVAVLSLALGIGANTAMFSLVNAVLLRELPVRDPDQLIEVYSSDGDYPYAPSSQPDFRDLRAFAADGSLLSGVIGTRTFMAAVERGPKSELGFGELISWDYFDVLGVPMALGRSFLPEEDEIEGASRVVILGHATWLNDFAGDPGVLGKSVRLKGVPYTVVGVAPAAFTGSMPVIVTGYYVPLMMTDELMGAAQMNRRESRSMFIKARIAPHTRSSGSRRRVACPRSSTRRLARSRSRRRSCSPRDSAPRPITPA
jgi:hypothetical protein